MVVSRRTLIGLAVADVVLFVIANATYNSARTVSNIAWVAFIVGTVLLIVLGVRALLQSRRSRFGAS